MKLIDLQRQARFRPYVREPSQFERGREGERPVIHPKLARCNGRHERNNDVPECVPRLEIPRDYGEEQNHSK